MESEILFVIFILLILPLCAIVMSILSYIKTRRIGAQLRDLQGRVGFLERNQHQATMPPRQQAPPPEKPAPLPKTPPQQAPPSEEPTSIPGTPQPPPPSMPAWKDSGQANCNWQQHAARTQKPPVKTPFDEKIAQAGKYVKDFFTTGNVVARIGLIVLFFGVAFLLKYVTTRYDIPVSARCIAVAIGAMALLWWGWRLRDRRMNFALILQGGAVGILYMDVFMAAKFYSLMPLWFALVVMTLLVVLSGLLAILQNARSTAFLGVLGGFSAPVLLSTGSGQHVVLFSYYALLTVGILWVSWFKAWRELNILGFVFTLGVGGIWGAKYYQPEYFVSTEPFLILFFVLYEAIAVLYAFRSPPKLRGYLDGALVFGTPVVAFGYQTQLVSGMEYGLAYSALGASIFYLFLARGLWGSQREGMRTLVEAFISLCIVFGSLAIPLAVDGRWTATAWALEGAALVWVGLRQERLRARIFGILIQIASGISFLCASRLPYDTTPVANGFYLGCLTICLGGLFTGYTLFKNKDRIKPWEKHFSNLALGWGLVWWFGAGAHEIFEYVIWKYETNAFFLFISFSALALYAMGKLLKWRSMWVPILALGPILVLFAVACFSSSWHTHPLAWLGYLAWPIALGASYALLRFMEDFSPRYSRVWHFLNLWVLIFLVTWEAAWGAGELIRGSDSWVFAVWGLVPGLCVVLFSSFGDKLPWPVAGRLEDYKTIGFLPLGAWIWAWCLIANYLPGTARPLPYVPLLNPLELSQIMLFVLLATWIARTKFPLNEHFPQIEKKHLYTLLGLSGFLAANSVVGRTVHFWGNVSWGGLGSSILFQTSLTIFWTTTALVLMVAASKKGSRPAWIIGAVLLAMVTAKLFFIDLSHSGALARVVSFLVAGGLMLLVGYFSPVPPSLIKENDK